MCEFNSQSYTFLFSVEFANTVFWKSAMGTSERKEAWGDKGNILRWKVERSFCRNFLVMCEFISQSYTYVSCSSPLSLFLKNLRSTSLDRIEAYADKGNIISWKRERSFLRNFFLICELHWQSYSIVLRKQCASTLLVESAKWYFGAHSGLWWKRKYLQIKTGKKASGKMHFDVWIQLTELHISLQWSVC